MSSLVQKTDNNASQIGRILQGISRLFNFCIHGKGYIMFCTSVYIIVHGGEHRGRIRSSVFYRFVSRYGFIDSLSRYLVWILFIPINCFLDIVFFFRSLIIKLFFKRDIPLQFHHCRDCHQDEQAFIPPDDWSGTRCIVWRNVFKFWR